jgi:uroporphyrinogen-III synthase
MNVVEENKVIEENKRKIVITRHEEGAADFSAAIHEANPNIELIYVPVLEIDNQSDGAYAPIPEDCAVITTSKQSKQALKRLMGTGIHTQYAIGMRRGVTDVHSMISYIERVHDKDVPLVYVRGRNVSHDLAEDLTAKGYAIEERIVYEAQAAKTLHKDFIAALRAKEINAVTFFSARSADIFENLIIEANLSTEFRSIKALCLSMQVVNSLTGLPWLDKIAAERKKSAYMVTLIEEIYPD